MSEKKQNTEKQERLIIEKQFDKSRDTTEHRIIKWESYKKERNAETQNETNSKYIQPSCRKNRETNASNVKRREIEKTTIRDFRVPPKT